MGNPPVTHKAIAGAGFERISATTRRYAALYRLDATLAPDPEGPPPIRCSDPDDDYLIALAHKENATLVSGDGHLLDLAEKAPIRSPAGFLAG
jgi:hypothetical protein